MVYVVPFWGSYLELYKVIPKRNYYGAYGYTPNPSALKPISRNAKPETLNPKPAQVLQGLGKEGVVSL